MTEAKCVPPFAQPTALQAEVHSVVATCLLWHWLPLAKTRSFSETFCHRTFWQKICPKHLNKQQNSLLLQAGNVSRLDFFKQFCRSFFDCQLKLDQAFLIKLLIFTPLRKWRHYLVNVCFRKFKQKLFYKQLDFCRCTTNNNFQKLHLLFSRLH